MIDGKYGRITTERGDFYPEEPVFLLRAQDPLAPGAIESYAILCEMEDCDPGHVAAVREAAARMEEWQEANPELVKARPGPAVES